MIEIRFQCGHVMKEKNSVSSARCFCNQPGSGRVVSVKAPAPSFRGTVLGPNTQFENLQPKDISKEMKGQDNG